MDEDAREAIQSVTYRKETDVAAQPNFQSLGTRATYGEGGVTGTTDGYLLFRFVDLKALCIELHQGDRFLQVGHQAVDIYIERLEPTGHYPDQDGATLLKAHCKDRAPSHDKRGEL